MDGAMTTAETPPTILCVDDDLEVLGAMARILVRDGYRVLTASRPAEALKLLAEVRIAVMVSDFDMPEMDGVQLAVRSMQLQPETTRVMVTGRRDVATALAGINVAEVFRFLHKPFEVDLLRREVAAAVAHHLTTSAIAVERGTVARRQQMIAALEHEHPGISLVARDQSGAYLVDGDAARLLGGALAPLVALAAAHR